MFPNPLGPGPGGEKVISMFCKPIGRSRQFIRVALTLILTVVWKKRARPILERKILWVSPCLTPVYGDCQGGTPERTVAGLGW